MRSIKEQRRDNALGVEQIELLDWAERARVFIYAYFDNCKRFKSTEGLISELQKLLEELPEDE